MFGILGGIYVDYKKEIIEMIEKNRKRSLVKNNIRIYKNIS